MKTKKLLPPDEQSLLLVSLLFARKHLDNIYSFFSDAQCERMNDAKTRFLRLEQGQRVTQIILELRRLLLIKENNFKWIHPTWFEHELAKEPAYLRAIIEPALYEQQPSSTKINDTKAVVSVEQVLQNFLTSFLNTPQRVALFDPVLMRLQSLHRDKQSAVISSIGRYALIALGQVLDQKRFSKFMQSNYAHLILNSVPLIIDNPLSHKYYKYILIKNILNMRKQNHKEMQIECGLWLISFYLFTYKKSWHRMIELVFERSLGMSLREKLKKLIGDKPETKNSISKLLIEAMDQSMIY